VTFEQKIKEMLAPTIESMGFEWWGCEYLSAGRHSTLRIFIDKPQGVTVDDCGTVSHQVSAIMDVEEPINDAYRLEISSPGVDRPLFVGSQYEKYIGEVIKLRTSLPVLGRRNFKGELTLVTETGIELEVDNEIYPIDFQVIDKANLEVGIKAKGVKRKI
jgi:ribosome maturation factor RimP